MIETTSHSAADRAALPKPVAATVALWMAVIFVSWLLLLHVVRADLDPSWHMVSEYAIGRFGWMNTAAFLSLAGAFFSLMVALRPVARGALGVTGLVFLTVASFGAAMGGLFATDPPGTRARAHLKNGDAARFVLHVGRTGHLVRCHLSQCPALARRELAQRATDVARHCGLRLVDDARVRRVDDHLLEQGRDWLRVPRGLAKQGPRPRLGALDRGSFVALAGRPLLANVGPTRQLSDSARIKHGETASAASRARLLRRSEPARAGVPRGDRS